jgi:threonine/homoserine/homoserine lactone efflux protein
MRREDGALAFNKKTTETSTMMIIMKAIDIKLLNPKLTLFFCAFLPLFVSNDSSSPMMEMIVLSAVFMGITLIVFALYGILASGVSSYLLNSAKAVKRLQQTFAVILAWFAVQLALTEK